MNSESNTDWVIAEILKHPLQTRISLSTAEFDSISVENSLHLSIPLKDFKTIIQHSDSLRASITAFYNNPGQPLQLVYERDGLSCAYTIMTRADAIGRMAAPIKHMSKSNQGPSRAKTVEAGVRQQSVRDSTSYLETPRAAVASAVRRDRSETPPQTGPYVEQSSFADFAEVQGSAMPPRGLFDDEDENDGANESVTWDVHGEGGTWRVQDRNVPQAKIGKRRRSEDDSTTIEGGIVGPTQTSNAPRGLFD